MYQIKSFISTKAELLDEKVNEWLAENPNIIPERIVPYMSYTSIKDKGAYMVGCTVIFLKFSGDSSRKEHVFL